MKLTLCALILAVLLLSCATASNVGNVPELPGDLSLTAPPEYPGYLLIAPEDLKSILTRMQDAETKNERIYEDKGDAIP